MSNRHAARTRPQHDDDGDAYVMVDVRAMLDLSDEPMTPMERPTLRGAQFEAAPETRRQDMEWRGFLGASRQAAIADAAASMPFWHRLTRRLWRQS